MTKKEHTSSYKEFEFTIRRAEHLLKLYELLKDSRKRNQRSDWTNSFKKFMNWPIKSSITRIDSKSAMLILKESAGFSRSQFSHEYLSELLRYSLVASISSLDKYCHDLLLEKSLKLLQSKECPEKLAKIGIPLKITKSAVDKIRKDENARPGNVVKHALQEVLHQYTFQDPSNIERWANMVGIKKPWYGIEKASGVFNNSGMKADKIRETLAVIARRRNQIVHEADLDRKIRHRKLSLREISHKEAEEAIRFIKEVVLAFERLSK